MCKNCRCAVLSCIVAFLGCRVIKASHLGIWSHRCAKKLRTAGLVSSPVHRPHLPFVFREFRGVSQVHQHVTESRDVCACDVPQARASACN